MAKALKFRIPDFCLLKQLFNAEPFSDWDVQQEKFINISPANTLTFYELAASVKETGLSLPRCNLLIDSIFPQPIFQERQVVIIDKLQLFFKGMGGDLLRMVQ